jgi:cytochrome P450
VVWSDNYSSLTKVKDGHEVFSFNTLYDEKRHTAIKKHIGHSFGPNAVKEYEPMVDTNLDLLIQRLRERDEVDMARWAEYFTTDTICKIAFDEDGGCLRTGSDATGFIAAAMERVAHWTYWSILPDSDRMLFRNPVITGLFQTTSLMAARTAEKVKKARNNKNNGSHTDLVHRFLAASDANPEVVGPREVSALVMSILTAGAGTTGYAAAIVLYHLMRNPKALAALEKELGKASSSCFEDLNKLKYLDAVIKESMRITSTIGHGIWRVAPPGGIKVAGVHVPAGTVMEVHVGLAHRNKDVFGDDSDDFRPERWLEAGEKQRIRMEKTWLGFGTGKRVCLGQNIAMLELKKLIPRLVTSFQVCTDFHRRSIADIVSDEPRAAPEASGVDPTVCHGACGPASQTYEQELIEVKAELRLKSWQGRTAEKYTAPGSAVLHPNPSESLLPALPT